MTTKKAIACVAAAILSLTLFAGSALADDGNTTPPTPPAETGTGTSSTDSAWLQQLQGYVDHIMQLRAATAELEGKLQAQHDTNHTLWTKLRQALTGQAGEQLKALKAQYKQAEADKLAPFKAQIQALEGQLAAAKDNKDAGKVMMLAAQIRDLRVEAKAQWDSLADLRSQIKALEDQLKATRGDVQAVKDQIAPLVQQEKELAAKDKELRTAKAAAWKAYGSALKADDHAAMLAALTTIADLKIQINANLGQILAIKQQIGTILSAAVAVHSSSTPITGDTGGSH